MVNTEDTSLTKFVTDSYISDLKEFADFAMTWKAMLIHE